MVISGCATSTYQSFNDDIAGVGYKDSKVDEGKYKISFYGLENDKYEDPEVFWHQRAAELCANKQYTSRIERKEQKNTVVRVSGYAAYPETIVIPYVTGEASCI